MALPMNRFEIYEALNLGKEDTVKAEEVNSEYMKMYEENNILMNTATNLGATCAKAKIIIDNLMRENARLSIALREAIKKNIIGN